MKFDPTKPCTIFNPMPQRLWPFKRGQTVLALARGGILRGKVRWYQPARKVDADCVVSEGHPILTIEYDRGRHSETVAVSETRSATRRGRRQLEAMIVVGMVGTVAHFAKELRAAKAGADQFIADWERRWKRPFSLRETG